MNIKIDVNLEEIYDEVYGSTSDYIKAIVQDDIKRQLKKSPEYKAYVNRMAEETISEITGGKSA